MRGAGPCSAYYVLPDGWRLSCSKVKRHWRHYTKARLLTGWITVEWQDPPVVKR